MARMLEFAEATGVEEKLVNRFADPEMYYLGKFMASLINNIMSKAAVESVNDLTNLISNSLGNNSYFDDILKLFGVTSVGQLASFMGGAGEVGGTAAVAAEGAVATTATGGIVLTAGSIILVIEEEVINLQLSEAEIPKNATKIIMSQKGIVRLYLKGTWKNYLRMFRKPIISMINQAGKEMFRVKPQEPKRDLRIKIEMEKDLLPGRMVQSIIRTVIMETVRA